MQKVNRKSRQSGFTLVEIAIVLVIVGLLLAGVLKGQELIENGRVKRAISDMTSLEVAMTSYLDRFKQLPGDDGPLATLQARGAGWATITAAGDRSGVIGAAAAATFVPAAGTEGLAFFQHLRAAGFLSGNPAATGVDAIIQNPWGGRTGIVVAALLQGRPNIARLLVCTSNVPAKSARAIDVNIDDGISNTGSLRATTGAGVTVPAAAVAAAYVDGETYTICRDLG